MFYQDDASSFTSNLNTPQVVALSLAITDAKLQVSKLHSHHMAWLYDSKRVALTSLPSVLTFVKNQDNNSIYFMVLGDDLNVRYLQKCLELRMLNE